LATFLGKKIKNVKGLKRKNIVKKGGMLIFEFESEEEIEKMSCFRFIQKKDEFKTKNAR